MARTAHRKTTARGSRPTAPRQSQTQHVSDDFYRGVSVALAVITSADAETLFDEIARAVDTERLIAVARKDGLLRLTGFTRYGYGPTGKR